MRIGPGPNDEGVSRPMPELPPVTITALSCQTLFFLMFRMLLFVISYVAWSSKP